MRAAAALALALTAAAHPTPAGAQGAQRANENCAAGGHRALDAWLGRFYQASPDGRVSGENRLEAILGGCAVWWRWHGASGGVGVSLNAYDRGSGRWHHMWVNGVSVVLQSEGWVEGDRILWRVTHSSVLGEGEMERWVWTTKPPLTHRVDVSEDGGETWEVVFVTRFVPWEGELPGNSRPRALCSVEPEHHALGFWTGAWRVEDQEGERIGYSRVDLLVKGCALRERGWSEGLGEYVRLMAYDATHGVWRMLMATDRGEVYTATGAREDESVVWEVEVSGDTDPAGVSLRWVMTPEEDEVVRWETQRSGDGGAWRTTSTRRYRYEGSWWDPPSP